MSLTVPATWAPSSELFDEDRDVDLLAGHADGASPMSMTTLIGVWVTVGVLVGVGVCVGVNVAVGVAVSVGVRVGVSVVSVDVGVIVGVRLGVSVGPTSSTVTWPSKPITGPTGIAFGSCATSLLLVIG